MEDFVCSRCGNKDSRYIGYLKGKPYCRLCISMHGESAKNLNNSNGPVVLKLNYPLSKEQKELSDQILDNYNKKIDTLVNAVCGAGKTELVYKVIGKCMASGKTVAFAVPRRDVVIELFMRIKEAFPFNKCVAVYGSHTSQLEGDIIVLTTHQFYRYNHYFDLIILDEIDAFPFKNNDVLKTMFERAKRGSVVLMSATPSKQVLEYFKKPNKKILELNTRFHRHPLPVPQIVVKIGYFKIPWIIKKIRFYISQNLPIFIFTPTIEKCETLFKILRSFIEGGECVHSKKKDRQEIIRNFREGKYKFLVTTAVLERGVTVKGLQVIIYDADNSIYDAQTLIQIAGRVGRKIDAPEGDVFFLVNKVTKEIDDAIETIKSKNTNL